MLSYWEVGDGVPQYRLGWPEGPAWRVVQASRFRTRFTLDGGGTLPLPHSRPELLFDAEGRGLILFCSAEHGNRLMLICLSPPDYAWASASHTVLVDEDLGQYER